MSTSSIGYSQYGSLSSLLLQNSSSSSSSLLASSTSSSSSSSTTSTSALITQINDLLSNVPKGDDNTLSFNDVKNYLESEQTKWDEAVKADFEELGINTYESFPLTWDTTNGTVVAASGHPDKAKIDAYFQNNPDMVEKFEEIVQLGKLTRTSQSTLTTTELKQTLQQQAMSIWYEDNSDPTTWFSGGGLLFGSGTYSGLNLKV